MKDMKRLRLLALCLLTVQAWAWVAYFATLLIQLWTRPELVRWEWPFGLIFAIVASVAGLWLIITEVKQYPKGEHDDILDAMEIASRVQATVRNER